LGRLRSGKKVLRPSRTSFDFTKGNGFSSPRATTVHRGGCSEHRNGLGCCVQRMIPPKSASANAGLCGQSLLKSYPLREIYLILGRGPSCSDPGVKRRVAALRYLVRPPRPRNDLAVPTPGKEPCVCGRGSIGPSIWVKAGSRSSTISLVGAEQPGISAALTPKHLSLH